MVKLGIFILGLGLCLATVMVQAEPNCTEEYLNGLELDYIDAMIMGETPEADAAEKALEDARDACGWDMASDTYVQEPKPFDCRSTSIEALTAQAMQAALAGNVTRAFQVSSAIAEYERLCVKKPPAPFGLRPINQVSKQQCQSLWAQFESCKMEWKRRLGSPNERMYTCQQPACSRW